MVEDIKLQISLFHVLSRRRHAAVRCQALSWSHAITATDTFKAMTHWTETGACFRPVCHHY